MDFPNVFKTKISAKGKNALNLSCNHLTTMDFGSFLPVYYRHLNPGEKLSVSASCFSRLNPLAYPTLGDVKIETRAFWVPYHIISESWQDFISNMQIFYDQDGTPQTPAVPTFRNSSIIQFFIDDAGGGIERFCKFVESSDAYDVAVKAKPSPTAQLQTYYLAFTTEGNFVVNMFHSLGYELNWDVSDTTIFNALGFLAFVRIFVDWYVNPNYDWSDVKRWFRGNDREIDESGFAEIMYYMPYVNYRPDYFTAAQKSTLVNNTVQNANFTVQDPSQVGVAGNPRIVSSLNSVSASGVSVGTSQTAPLVASLNNYGIELVQKLADFLKRNNLAGARYVDQMLVRFGSRPSDEVAMQSSYLGSLITNVQMSDVMQTAPDVNASFAAQGVGQYTGKGIAFENGHWSLETNEHGVFMVVSTIRPRTQYYQGRDRHNLHLSQLDFYTPEFDGVNLQAIRQDELITLNGPDYVSASAAASNPYSPSAVFGFTPRYAEYKISKDWLTGDFRRARLANTMRCFHLFRELSKEAAHQKAGYNFEVITNSDRLNYDRIFQSPGTGDNPYDHFICNFVFDVKYITSVKPIGESLMPEDGGKDIDVRPFGMYF